LLYDWTIIIIILKALFENESEKLKFAQKLYKPLPEDVTTTSAPRSYTISSAINS
jgi:hypothetical protein